MAKEKKTTAKKAEPKKESAKKPAAPITKRLWNGERYETVNI